MDSTALHGATPGGARRGMVPPAATVATVQGVLDVLDVSAALLSPVRSPDGEVSDYVILAASPVATDQLGRRGAGMVGLRVRDAYPGIADGELWRAYHATLATGQARVVGPFTYTAPDRDTAPGSYSVQVSPVAGGFVPMPSSMMRLKMSGLSTATKAATTMSARKTARSRV